MSAAVFLDRDGTIIEERHYLHRPEEVVLLAGAGRALQRLSTSGFRLIILSNQSGVGRGLFGLADVQAVNQRMLDLLAAEGVTFDAIYIAPEAPDQPSHGRKPSPAFLFDARDQLGINLEHSYMIGDKLIDLECGWNGGVKACILVRTGYGASVEKSMPDVVVRAAVVDDLPAAADWILGQGTA